jgi:hypothetical protein
MARWQLGFIAVFLAVFGVTVVLTGVPMYFFGALMLVGVVLAWSFFNWAMTKRLRSRYGSLEEAMSDERQPWPVTHLIPDDRTAAGDTPEAHDELNPHDLPAGHPGRRKAHEQAGGATGTTHGDADPAAAAEERGERFERRPRVERGG